MSKKLRPILEYKQLDAELPNPEYQTVGSVGFDLYAREDKEIQPGEIAIIPGNVIAKVPSGFALVISLRSSSPKRLGVSVPHGIGVIDRDYHGEDDEIGVQVINHTDDIVRIERGDRIAQAFVVYSPRLQLLPTLDPSKSRGGFGSTG